MWFQGRICVPNITETKETILKEAHQTPYSIHLRSTNMYMDLKKNVPVEQHEKRDCKVSF
jgi:hypothetical protein